MGGGGGGGGGGERVGISAKGFFTHCKRVSTLHTPPVKLVTLILYGSVHKAHYLSRVRYPKKLHLTFEKCIVFNGGSGGSGGSE